MTLLSAALLVALVVSVNSDGLRDNPIVGDSAPLYLDGKWTATNDEKLSIPATVPGDLITDLYNASKIKDPLYETVWIDNSAMWDGHVWNYSVTFPYKSTSAREVLLVFDGVKMGAYIILNGQHVGVVNNQFLRYEFPVKQLLKAGDNELIVSFPKTSEIDVEGRFMACSGGWDWAPYSNTRDQHGATTLSKGIWKSVYLVPVSSAAISHVVPLVYYNGEYPTAPLTDSNHASFTVNVSVHFIVPEDVSGSLVVSGTFGTTSKDISLKAGTDNVASVVLTAPPSVKLWWPAGLGDQNLYPIVVSFKPQNSQPLVTTNRRIGFRVFALVTANDTEPSTLKGVDGSGTLTMRFRVNGANIWSRGGNMIPMEEYEGRANADAFTYLLNSARDGNFNTLRIWGGGIFLYDVFYDRSDELGLLMYHDMMYAQGHHSPAATRSQDQEIRHQVRRLSAHPSIAIWDACNECGGQGIYASFVSTTIAEVDNSRPVWPSCPSDGWVSGVDRLYGLPNGKPLNPRNGGANFETHGPYQHGSGWPAVNGDRNLEPFPPNLPPYFEVAKTGPQIAGKYASEFGCVGWSSFESMSPTVAPEHYSLHAPPMYQRNYPCDNIIQVYWGPQTYPAGEIPFKKQLYQCLIGQALELKADIEARRASNEWGTVIWQLNEVWPTGGWGTVEYGTPVEGQVVGGRWKPVHYYLRNSVFADVMATCGLKGNCYIKNDGITAFTGRVTLSLVHFTTGKVDSFKQQSVQLSAGAGVSMSFCASDASPGVCASWDTLFNKYGCVQGGVNCILTASVTNSTGGVVSSNLIALQIPGNMNLPPAKVRVTSSQSGANGATVELTTDKVAVFVVLTTAAPGRFSDNAFLLLPGTTSVTFEGWANFNFDKFSTTLRVEHAQLNK